MYMNRPFTRVGGDGDGVDDDAGGGEGEGDGDDLIELEFIA